MSNVAIRKRRKEQGLCIKCEKLATARYFCGYHYSLQLLYDRNYHQRNKDKRNKDKEARKIRYKLGGKCISCGITLIENEGANCVNCKTVSRIPVWQGR